MASCLYQDSYSIVSEKLLQETIMCEDPKYYPGWRNLKSVSAIQYHPQKYHLEAHRRRWYNSRRSSNEGGTIFDVNLLAVGTIIKIHVRRFGTIFDSHTWRARTTLKANLVKLI